MSTAARYLQPWWAERPDETTQAFIRIVTADPDLDYQLGRLLALFGPDLPWLDSGYSHHDGYRTP